MSRFLELEGKPLKAIIGATLALIAFCWAWSALFGHHQFRDQVDQWSQVRGLDPVLVTSVIRCESGFRRQACSPAGALGLMQLMPETALWLAESEGVEFELEALYEADYNIRLGTRYLSLLMERFDQDTLSALAAYNAGPTVVSIWRTPGQPLRMDQIRYPETRHYVQRVMSTRRWLNRFY